MDNPMLDSREGWTLEEEREYNDILDAQQERADAARMDDEMIDDDYDDLDEIDTMTEFDGQPDEYTEWQDYYGGDDWDHGQYDYY